MALEFSGIRDEKGTALYFVHDGSPESKEQMTKLMSDVQEHTLKQCILLGLDTETARNIADFYDLQGTHMVVIVRDDDQLHHVWSDGDHFDAGRIAYSAERAG